MVKCVVSGCPNRMLTGNRGLLNRPPKRFFSFPKDPARVKVWLAALRETDTQDSAEQRLICEDHFLPDDLSTSSVNGDAIPIMPPCLDGSMSMMDPWGAGSSSSSSDEDRWAAGGEDEDAAVEDEGGDDVVSTPEPPPVPPKRVRNPDPAVKTSADGAPQRKVPRQDVSLGMLTQRFLELLLLAPDGVVDLRHVTASLQTRKRRVYDITSVLDGISLIEKQSANRVKWIGNSPISSFLWRKQQTFQKELENLQLVEDTLDGLIKSCAQQLFDMTDDTLNSASAYVTHDDVSRLAAFQEQTVIVVKAPEETKLEVPAPKEDSIQVHLKGGNGPIMVLSCEMGSGEAQSSSCFVTLEDSRIKTDVLHTESSSQPSAMQTA
ncbi:transcription factor E2F6 [Embiotoca jacksoni]|uniref:transcription factor E2F6 n=1 Tax=Embiotoca jacksoni TaxID=100190 RepID=UPI0037048BB4